MGKRIYALVMGLLPLTALSQETWSLTTSDFNTQQVNVTSIDDKSLNILGATGTGTPVPLDKLLVLERSNPAPLAASKWRVYLVGDEQILGEPIEMKGEDLRFKTAPLGEVNVPLKRVVAMVKAGGSAGELPENRTEDQVTLANGDVVTGIISEFSATTVTVQRTGGETTPVPMDAISRVVLASTGGNPEEQSRSFRVTLSDGTSISTPVVQLDGSRLRVEAFNGKQGIPIAAVKSIEQINGPVVWLSSLTPQEDVQIPYYGDRPRKSARNLTVLGQPLRFGSQTFARGIGVHSLSRLTYAVDPSFRVFRTQYAIDGELPWADVTVRVKLDGKTVHEQKNVKSGKLASVVSVDLNGAKTLTLEVDYGENYDVQDRLNWIEAAMLR